MRTSKLHAVNRMLQAVQAQPVALLPSSSDPGEYSLDALQAENLLEETLITFLLEGWYFNRVKELEVQPDVNGEIFLHENWLSVDGSRNRNGRMDLVERDSDGQRLLYDLDSGTKTFTSSVFLDVVEYLAFERLPEAARQTVMVRAANDLARLHEMVDPFDLNKVQQTESRMRRDQYRNRDYNYLKGTISVKAKGGVWR